MRTLLRFIGIFALAVSLHLLILVFFLKISNFTRLIYFLQFGCTKSLPLDSQFSNIDNSGLANYLQQSGFELIDLIKMAKVSGRFTKIITNMMLNTYRIHEKTVRIEKVEQELDNKNAIFLSEYDAVLEFLEHFGNIIQALHFSGMFFSGAERLRINHYIAKYCSQSLKRLELRDADHFLIGVTNQIFPRVLHVTVQNFEYINDLQLNRIYPNIENLTIWSYDLALNSLPHHYPHLKHFTTFNTDEGIVMDLLRLNPQLRSLSFNDVPSLEFIDDINKALPHLELLEVKHFANGFHNSTDRIQNIHFANVRHFGLLAEVIGSDIFTFDRIPISFSDLQTLKIGSLTTNDVYHRLIQENNHIEILRLERVFEIETIPIITSFVNQLDNLEELSISWVSDVEQADIVELLGNLQHLRKVIFDFLVEFDCDSLASIVSSTWKIEHEAFAFDTCMITFEER